MTPEYIDTPAVHNLPPIAQGQDWSWSFQLLQPDGVTPVNLTGTTFEAKLKIYPSDVSAAYTFTPSVANSTGTVTLSIPRATTLTFTQEFVYDIFYTDALANRAMILRGKAPVIIAVTK